MSTTITGSCVHGIAWLVSFALTLSVDASAAELEVEASFAMESSSLTLDQPVRMRFLVVNRSPDTIELDLGRDSKEHYSFVLTWPDGSREPVPSLPEREGLHELGQVKIAPGASLMRMLLLNEWMAFHAKGDYQLEVTLRTPIRRGRDALYVPTSRHRFVVTDRDEVVLDQVCESLTRQIELATSVREAHDAASALARISEPLAVPYLERALASGKYVEVIVIDALATIGNANAVRVLTGLVDASPRWIPDPNTTVGSRALRAYRALKTVASTTSDEALASEVARVLQRIRAIADGSP
jgi:hypothetical protein